jgi:hypothetical protein
MEEQPPPTCTANPGACGTAAAADAANTAADVAETGAETAKAGAQKAGAKQAGKLAGVAAEAAKVGGNLTTMIEAGAEAIAGDTDSAKETLADAAVDKGIGQLVGLVVAPWLPVASKPIAQLAEAASGALGGGKVVRRVTNAVGRQVAAGANAVVDTAATRIGVPASVAVKNSPKFGNAPFSDPLH